MGSAFWEVLKDPVAWAGFERIIIELGGVFCMWAGYKFYRLGLQERSARGGLGSLKSNFWTSGTGAGLFGLLFGASILIAGLLTGREGTAMRLNEGAVPAVTMKHMRLLEEGIAKLDHACARLIAAVKKVPPDNATCTNPRLLQLKEELAKLAARLESREQGKTWGKSKSRYSKRRTAEGGNDNSSTD